jgi:hypothetical protein
MHARIVSTIAKLEPKMNFSRAAIFLVAIGIVLRLVRWLQNYPMWCDETMLAANLLDRDWTELAKPLAYRQVCPLGFLALEWIVVRLAGFSELSLRVVPVVCAVASVPLFHFLARHVLGGGSAAMLIAVTLFAVAEGPIRYAAEVKPYSADLLISLMLLSLAVSWLKAPSQARPLWAMAALVPLAVVTSLPSVFTIGAVAMIGFPEVFARRGSRLWLAYVAFLCSAALAGAAMLALGQYSATPAARAYLIKYWNGAFPPSWREPGAIVGWLVRTHTGPLFAYPFGANRFAGQSALMLGCLVIGTLVCRRISGKIVVLLVLPFLLVMMAAVAHRYPYGASVRLAQFLTPATLLLASAGLAWLSADLRPSPLARWAGPALAVVLVSLGAWRLGQDLVSPCRVPWDRTGREFARWFWEELAADAELVCVQTDLGIPFRPAQWAYGTDQYLCLQRIYSRRHQRKLAPRWDEISAARPLRCVLFNRMPSEVPAFLAWIEANADRYALREVTTYPAMRGSKDEPTQTYVVCEFVPASARHVRTAAERELSAIKDRAAARGFSTAR